MYIMCTSEYIYIGEYPKYSHINYVCIVCLYLSCTVSNIFSRRALNFFITKTLLYTVKAGGQNYPVGRTIQALHQAFRLSLHTSQVSHLTKGYPGFCIKKRLGIFNK